MNGNPTVKLAGTTEIPVLGLGTWTMGGQFFQDPFNYQPIKRGELAKPGYRTLDSLAVKYKKTRAQIAINWLISQPGVITIPKASNLNHLKEIRGAVGRSLSAEDAQLLGEEFLNVQP